MFLVANFVTAIVALLHLWFMVIEMFLWTKPYGRRVFKMSEEQAQATRVLAANQGLYNGFLAAGIVWGLALGAGGFYVRLFFLGCVVTAGIFGAITANRRILFVQALPGAIAMVLTWLSASTT
jgi:putative membrane protein